MASSSGFKRLIGGLEEIKDLPREQGRFVYLTAVALLVAMWGLRLVFLGAPVFPLDDAYINIHNANVLLGLPAADYAGVPYLTGTTCTPHLLLLSSLSLFLGGNWAAETVTWIGAIAYALGLVYPSHRPLWIRLSSRTRHFPQGHRPAKSPRFHAVPQLKHS